MNTPLAAFSDRPRHCLELLCRLAHSRRCLLQFGQDFRGASRCSASEQPSYVSSDCFEFCTAMSKLCVENSKIVQENILTALGCDAAAIRITVPSGLAQYRTMGERRLFCNPLTTNLPVEGTLGDRRTRAAFQNFSLVQNGKPLPVECYFMRRREGGPGLEVADFIMHAIGRQARHNVTKRGPFQPNFAAVFHGIDTKLVSFMEVSSVVLRQAGEADTIGH
ncbi:hypothetical protein QRQ56_34825 [Bradyrhizobium sp. U531]|uniref:hypothetical protein n=1 Tax=Bradyrhizobium sp. U531 TaxID=3053458 RepID=UPI003F427BD2